MSGVLQLLHSKTFGDLQNIYILRRLLNFHRWKTNKLTNKYAKESEKII